MIILILYFLSVGELGWSSAARPPYLGGSGCKFTRRGLRSRLAWGGRGGGSAVAVGESGRGRPGALWRVEPRPPFVVASRGSSPGSSQRYTPRAVETRSRRTQLPAKGPGSHPGQSLQRSEPCPRAPCYKQLLFLLPAATSATSPLRLSVSLIYKLSRFTYRLFSDLLHPRPSSLGVMSLCKR